MRDVHATPAPDASGSPVVRRPLPERAASETSAPGPGVRVITFGTFDLFHIGHLNLLRRARAAGDWLVVGVSSDELNRRKKGRQPVIALEDRLAIVGALRCVDEVFVEEALELKGDYIHRHRANVLVMGDDWRGRLDDLSTICRVVYLPRTSRVSSSSIRSVLGAA